jgi:hypothetical protein
MDIQRVAYIMENSGRVFITKQERTDRQEWTRLKPIAEKLAPMVALAQAHQTEALQARGQMEQAEQAARHWRAELEAAQSNLERSTREAAEYIAGLKLDI